MALEMLLLRVAAGDGAPGAEASVLKIRGSEIQQDLAMLQMEVAGRTAGPTTGLDAGGRGLARAGAGDGGCRRRGYADMRKTSIYGGTTEVQKGIIARHALGL